MKNIVKLVIVIFFSSFALEAFSQSECELKVGWMERPSYQYKKRSGKPAGFDIEYVRLLGKELGCDVSFRYIPWLRQMKELAEGRLDLLLGTVPNRGDLGVYLLTDVYRKDPMGFYRLKSNYDIEKNVTLTQFNKNGLRFGLNFHDIRTQEIYNLIDNQATSGNISLQKNTKALLRNLNKKHIDAVIIHSAEIDYLKQINDPLVADIVLVPHLSYNMSVAMVSATTTRQGAKLVDKVNRAIKVLNNNDSYKKLVDEYAPSHLLIKDN